MANNYTYFSLSVHLDDPEAEWVKKVLGYASNCDGDVINPEDGPESRDLLEIWPDWNDRNYLGFDWEVRGEIDGLWIYTEAGEGNTDAVADFLQFFLAKFGLKTAIQFHYALTCGKPRPGEFSGGACVVTAEDQQWSSLSDWVEITIDEMLAEMVK